MLPHVFLGQNSPSIRPIFVVNKYRGLIFTKEILGHYAHSHNAVGSPPTGLPEWSNNQLSTRRLGIDKIPKLINAQIYQEHRDVKLDSRMLNLFCAQAM